MRIRTNIFDIVQELRLFGLAYCLWRGHRLWDIFVASRLIKRGV